MPKKVLIICGSPHANSHSDALAKNFAIGAEESGHAVKTIKLAKQNIKPCLGCDACRNSGSWECIQKDDMQALYGQITEADIIALATPLYFLTVSAQLKTFIDRLYPKYHAGEIGGKKAVLLSTSGGPGSDVISHYFNALCGLTNWENAGTVTQGGLRRSNEAGPSEEKKAEAYELGKKC